MTSSYLPQSIALALGVCVSASVWATDNEVELGSETDRTSYALGYQIGSDFQRQSIELNDEAMVQGIADALSGASSLMSEESMRATLIELKRKVVGQERSAPQLVRSSAKGVAKLDVHEAVTGNAPFAQPHAQRPAAKPTDGAREFFEKNAKQEGMVTLPSGLQYRVLKAGAGKQPKETDNVALIYRGTLVNGNEFGNTYQAGKPVPKTFAVNSLVPGMREAVSHMNEGAKWQVFVPPQLGFNASTPLYRKITVFDVELVAVNP